MIRRNAPGLLLLILTILISYTLATRWWGDRVAGSWGLLLAIQFAGFLLAFGWMWWRERRSLLRELYAVLKTLDEFDPDEAGTVDFPRSRVPVLRELHQNLQALINRIRENYRSSKQFSQNAAHELQTPLAAIKTNVEMLLQSPGLSRGDADALAAILQNTTRLSRLNQALVMLSRIEKHAYPDEESVDVRTATEEVLQNFQDLIEIQKLAVRRDYQSEVRVSMSATLAEILIANLVQNAIRHNRPGGFIDIQIRDHTLILSNPGQKLEAPPETLFRRFHRQSRSEDSLGLGLSIVRRICDRYGFAVTYRQPGELHRLEVDFEKG